MGLNFFESLLHSKVFLGSGGAGFIGSAIVYTLIELGVHQVKVLDNLETSFLKNLDDLISLDKFEFIKGDICDYETCLKSYSGVDFVLHNAALGSVSRSITNH